MRIFQYLIVIMECKTVQIRSNDLQLQLKGGTIKRLQSVCGHEERVNDVLYCPRQLEAVEIESTVVYFGGDIQDYAENMENQRDGKKYVQWSLEETTQLLHRKFPMSHIVVIKPSKMEYSSFSCFKNFVQCNDFGTPDHCPNYYAIDHLEKLLMNVSKRLSCMDEKVSFVKRLISRGKEVQIGLGQSTMGDSDDIILIGFSKGCVVLNQLMLEFHYRITNSDDGDCIIGRIREIYWLDGGHSGGRNTWITSKPILQTVAQLPGIYSLHIHVTPYQVEDNRRPWIRKEERVFSDTLSRLGVSLHRQLHFSSADSDSDIDVDTYMHFNVLNVFKPDVL